MNFKKKGLEQDRLFVAVEMCYNEQGYKVYYPTIYKEEALEYIKHPQFYLKKITGRE